MFEGTMHRGFRLDAQHQIALACAVAVTVLLAIGVLSFKPVLALVPIAVLGAVLLWIAVRYTTAHPLWLMFPLMMVELFTAGWFFPGESRAMFHYGLTAVFCLPLLPAAWRNRTFARGGFGLYSWYFLWAAVTILYSLAPQYSAARLFDALIVFGAISFVISQVREPRQVPALLTPLLLGCAIVTCVVLLSAFTLPRNLTWIIPGEVGAEYVDFPRFTGIFNGPNDIGELMLVTVGCAAVLWPALRGKWRWLVGLLIVMALGTGALADSRTPFVALAIGGTCYALWKYRGRAVIAMLVLALLVGVLHFRPDSEGYLARGNVSTLTGRTDVWQFAVSQVKARPLLGHGYDVSGAILQSRYFPVWWGPWDEGPHSSLHDGYIDRAVGVGVPALLLWLFIVLRPWFAATRRPDDQWGLKRMACWMVVPMLIHNLAEVSISDCTGMVGVSFFLIWAIAERSRILRLERDRAERVAQHSMLSPAAAALGGGVLLVLALIMLPAVARAQSTFHFPAPVPHAALLSSTNSAVTTGNGRVGPRKPHG
jgi:O-antigen ligase